jgi:hypothetical protein
MAFSILLLAAAAQAASHRAIDPEQARAAGYAQAQAALAATDGNAIEQSAPEPIAQAASPSTAAATAAQQGGGVHPLALTCLGGGTANKTTVTSAWGSGSFSGYVGNSYFGGSTSSSAMAFGTRQQGFADQTDIQLFSGDDRIRLPRTMLPTFHGGQGGWFKLKDVTADERSIRASVAVFAFHSPKIYIDRVTGTISISGKDGDYVGRCQAMREDAVAKF